jgi:nicotinamide-nucleotide amidase
VENYLIPHLVDLDPLLQPRVEKGYILCGTGESNIDAKTRQIIHEHDPVFVSSLPRPGIVEVTFYVKEDSPEEKARLEEVTEAFEQECGRYLVGPLGVTLEGVVGDLLKDRKETVGVAESCTGGLIGGRLTAVLGSSEYFLGGVIAYSNAGKSSWRTER